MLDDARTALRSMTTGQSREKSRAGGEATMADAPINLLHRWLERQLPEASYRWFTGQLAELVEDPSERALHILLGLIPRRLGRDDLALDAEDLAAAAAARSGWDPAEWSVDETARILVLIEAGRSGMPFVRLFTDLCRSADVHEAIALYRGLPLYPEPERLEPQAAEGVRTNLRAVFEAVAHRNPYPRECFDENRWNQMVLKALFIDSRLAPIQGLDERANPALARILCDYAHERWAAGRPVSPELWRCVGPFAVGKALDDLERVMASEDETERKAAALALAASAAPGAKALLGRMPEHAGAIERGTLTWRSLETRE